MTDVHCHVNFKSFAQDYDEVIKRAVEAGVTKIINVGTKIDTNQKAIELAEKYENLYAIVGIHPHHADKIEVEPRKDREDWLKQLKKLAEHPKVLAIGEIGMDNYYYKSNGIIDQKLQETLFRKQIELSIQLKLPLQIHNRLAGASIMQILSDYKKQLLNPPGMFHCMSGNVPFLKEVVELGFYVGFDGNITYEGIPPGEDTALADLVKAAPFESIVVETDSPYLTPIPLRGSRNEPKNVIIIRDFIAKLKDVPSEVVESTSDQNVHTLFKTI